MAVHPVADSIALPAPDPSQALTTSQPEPGEPHPFVESLLEAPVVVEIGELDGSQEVTFGEIADATVAPDGSIVVLDRQTVELRFFAEDGEFIQTLGGQGEGPGEFFSPTHLVRTDTGGLWVVDLGGFIHRFEDGSEGLEFVERTPTIPHLSRGACSVGTDVVVHYPAGPEFLEGGAVLQRVDPELNPMLEFARVYNHSYSGVTGNMREGVPGCGPDGLVILVLGRLGRAVAYDSRDGSLLWQREFSGLSLPGLIEYENPPAFNGFELGGRDHFHEPLRTVLVPGGPVIVQWKRTLVGDMMADRADRYRVESWVLDPETGAGEYVGEELPEILHWDDRRIIVLTDDVFPRIRVLQAPGSAGR